MLPVDKKIIENVVKKQLMNYIEFNVVLSPNQSTFRAHIHVNQQSTSSTLMIHYYTFKHNSPQVE